MTNLQKMQSLLTEDVQALQELIKRYRSGAIRERI